MSGMWHDCLAEGHLAHQRRAPVAHAFSYRMAMLLLDLDRVEGGTAGDVVRPRWLRARRDFRAILSDWPGATLRERVNAALHAQGRDAAPGPCLALFQPASLGVGFNPVRFVFCLTPDGMRIRHVLAEINNTPWNERHTYVLSADVPSMDIQFEFGKDFHVSPFNAMSQRYRWHFTLARDALEIRMEVIEAGRDIFSAAMSLRLTPLDAGGMLRLTLRYPLQPLRNLVRIYWQALRLKTSGAHFHAHPRHAPATIERHGGPS